MSISIVRKYTEAVRPPRSIFLRWPFGHPLGEPFNVPQQRAVIGEAFRALYSIKEPGTIVDVPFRWKREDYTKVPSSNHKPMDGADDAIEDRVIHEDGDDAVSERDKEVASGRSPLFWALTGGFALLAIYFLILTAANSFSHAVEQFTDIWPWITALVAGFGFQAGLYSYIRHEIRQRKSAAAATSSVAAAGGISTTSMVACCAHHVTDILPILGVSAAVVFLNQFQDLFLTIGVMSNIIGITLMLKIIQEHHLFSSDDGILHKLMRFDMGRSLYVVSVLSAFIVLLTLYRSI